MLSQSLSVLLLGLKRMQEKEEKDSRPRVMTDLSREAGKGTPQKTQLFPPYKSLTSVWIYKHMFAPDLLTEVEIETKGVLSHTFFFLG